MTTNQNEPGPHEWNGLRIHVLRERAGDPQSSIGGPVIETIDLFDER